MKALRTGSYRKMIKGVLTPIFTYEVNGTTAELEAYKQAQLARTGTPLTEANWAERGCSKNGKPLYWLTANVATGSIPKAQLNLTITTNNNVVVDNTIEVANEMEQLAHMVLQEKAKGIADIQLGLRAVVTNNFTTTSTAAPIAAAPKADENASDFHQDVANIENSMLEGAAAGSETLTD